MCHTSMPVRNGNLGTDRTTTTKAASVRKELGTKNSKSNEERRECRGALTEGLVRSRLQLDGYVERMADDRLPAELREQGRRRRGSQG